MAPLPIPATMDEEAFLAFLLIDHWHFSGHARWRTLQSVRDMLEEM